MKLHVYMSLLISSHLFISGVYCPEVTWGILDELACRITTNTVKCPQETSSPVLELPHIFVHMLVNEY